MTTTNNTTTITYRQIAQGIFGTGLHFEPRGTIAFKDNLETVEIVIVKKNYSCEIREMAPSGQFTDFCLGFFFTMEEAQECVAWMQQQA